ncbi:MAG: fatty acid desaturase [Cryobacterium sp.]|nr:fatty acid desaturase [Oligoflexia bacterium]
MQISSPASVSLDARLSPSLGFKPGTTEGLNESLLGRALAPPSYGYSRNGELYVPSHREIWREFETRMNPLHAENWLPVTSWFFTLALTIPFFYFFIAHFNFATLCIGLFYSMVLMGTHGTVYLHRFSTHRAYAFRNSFTRFFVRNLTIKVIPEEIYVISHHVHHWCSEKPGDPYNVNGGWLYCFLADATHQRIAQDLSEKDYSSLKKLLSHTGVKLNTYAQYRRWGSLCHPVRTWAHYLLNWGFWFGAFSFIGGVNFAIGMFGMAGVWAFGVRTFNFDGHGRGKDRRKEGSDFNWKDFSVNQVWPGYVAGEWHNNHHLYPNSAQSGFLPNQLDLAWEFIRFYQFIGGIKSSRNYRAEFYRDHYEPYLQRKSALKQASDSNITGRSVAN